jgi:hypothetical protein
MPDRSKVSPLASGGSAIWQSSRAKTTRNRANVDERCHEDREDQAEDKENVGGQMSQQPEDDECID